MVMRVLSVDGGGMRGIYSAAYLGALETAAVRRRELPPGTRLDIGKGFDLVVGTSTGAIIGCGLAHGLAPATMVDLYRRHGKRIFPQRIMRHIWQLPWQLVTRKGYLAAGDAALRKALEQKFGSTTIAQIHRSRGIKLCIPSVNMANYRSWVFKTPHAPITNHRDDETTLVEACLASSAAPLYRSLARIQNANGSSAVFADGGLWANNPVLVALAEALDITAGSADRIEIYCLGSCGKPEGQVIQPNGLSRGYLGWRFGADAAVVSIAAQEFAFDYLARSLARHLACEVRIIRFPAEKIPASLLDCLDLDVACAECLDALVNHAAVDADMTNGKDEPKEAEGAAIRSLFDEVIPIYQQEQECV